MGNLISVFQTCLRIPGVLDKHAGPRGLLGASTERCRAAWASAGSLFSREGEGSVLGPPTPGKVPVNCIPTGLGDDVLQQLLWSLAARWDLEESSEGSKLSPAWGSREDL